VDDMPVKATQAIRDSVNHVLEHDFGIGHAVIQVEC